MCASVCVVCVCAVCVRMYARRTCKVVSSFHCCQTQGNHSSTFLGNMLPRIIVARRGLRAFLNAPEMLTNEMRGTSLRLVTLIAA